MRYISLFLFAFLTGCASVGDITERNVSPAQNYRPAGSEQTVSISGTMDRIYQGLNWKAGGVEEYSHFLQVFFDDDLTISGNLSPTYTGEVFGEWQERPVSASCSSDLVSASWRAVRCMVFIENERTVTLTF